MKRALALALVCVTAPAVVMRGQSPPPSKVLFVAIDHPQEPSVPPLVKESFEVLDNNKTRPIVSLERAIQPITAIVMLDSSASMAPISTTVRAATRQLLAGLPQSDRLRVASFDVTVRLSPRFTTDRDELFRELDNIRFANGTALWDAVLFAIDALQRTPGHRVIVVTTDGEDTESSARLDTVTDRARANNVTVYGVGLKNTDLQAQRAQQRRPDASLRKLADETGGVYVDLQAPGDLATAYARIAQELHDGYMIRFTPTVVDGRIHKLAIKVKNSGLIARARRSYLAELDLLPGDAGVGGGDRPTAAPGQRPSGVTVALGAQTPVGAIPAFSIQSVDADGKRYLHDVSVQRSNRLPMWRPDEAAEPPVSMSAAVKAAETWLLARNSDVRAFEPSNVMLARWPSTAVASGSCRNAECWFYRLFFDPIVGGRRLAGGSNFTAIVLMDGAVVEPRLETTGSQQPVAGSSGGAAGTGAAGAPGSSIVRDGVTVYRPGGDVTMPRLVREVRPQYTSDAMRARIQGTVVIEIVLKTDGTVGETRVVRSLDTLHGLDDEALKAAKQWQFSPATRGGQPVPALLTIEMSYTVAK